MQQPQAADLGLQQERVTRIELALSAWEATALGGLYASDLHSCVPFGPS